MKWGGLKNGALLELIERERFDIFLTGDKKYAQTAAARRASLCRADHVRKQLAGDQTAR
jgi:putative NIF3 family GTP cyclohydrolase 1 type 2